MSIPTDERLTFVTLVTSEVERTRARLLIESLRSFGGTLASCPFWVFESGGVDAGRRGLAGERVEMIPLEAPEYVERYYFGRKVCACALAEERASSSAETLVWIDPAVLMVAPPALYELGETFDAAVRPVHIANVGSSPDEPLDAFWERVCSAVGLDDIGSTVRTFVDGRTIRSYFNSHALSVDPSLGLFQRWRECFEELVCDREYQDGACSDERHRIFLHQAVLSALMVAEVEPARIRELPPEYNYPYNLQESVPEERRAASMKELVSVVYEGRSLDPGRVNDIELGDRLASWLSSRISC